MKDTDLKDLTLKAAFWLALTSGKRHSEIHAWFVNKVSHFVQCENVGGGALGATLFSATPCEFSCYQYLRLGIGVLLTPFAAKQIPFFIQHCKVKGAGRFYITKFLSQNLCFYALSVGYCVVWRNFYIIVVCLQDSGRTLLCCISAIRRC